MDSVMDGIVIALRIRWKTQQYRVDSMHVYRIRERTDGQPSINTYEGWEALRKRVEERQRKAIAEEAEKKNRLI